MKLIAPLLLLLLFSSCTEKEIIIELDKHESKLVVNSFFSPSDSISINLSKSIAARDIDAINYIHNAEIQLYCQNQLVNTMNYQGNGMYSLKSAINYGDKYKIVIDAPGFISVEASNTIPEQPQVLSFDTIHIDDELLYCEIAFKSDLSTSNYYLVEVESKNPVYDSDSILSHQVDIINSDILVENGGLEEKLKRLVLSTELLQDSIYELGFVLDKTMLQETYSESSNTIYIHFKKISEEYYLYVKSYYEAETKHEDIYTNIENGYGIFAGYGLVTDSIEVVYDL